MLRGEVHFLPVPLPDPDNLGGEDVDLDHFVIVLRGSNDEHRVPFVVAASNTRLVDYKPSYEVHFDGHPFHHPTIIDCRWVMTLPSWHFNDETFRFWLDEEDMIPVDIALMRALQLE